jgi:adenosylmethionine-8-amino-7-oxononanoate aminotransferase
MTTVAQTLAARLRDLDRECDEAVQDDLPYDSALILAAADALEVLDAAHQSRIADRSRDIERLWAAEARALRAEEQAARARVVAFIGWILALAFLVALVANAVSP